MVHRLRTMAAISCAELIRQRNITLYTYTSIAQSIIDSVLFYETATEQMYLFMPIYLLISYVHSHIVEHM